jgi:hypothetical protein
VTLPRVVLGLVAALVALALLWVGYRLIVLQPSNQRDWEFGMETLPHVTIDGNQISVQHVRDFHWGADGSVAPVYVDRSFDLDDLERVWFVEEPFTIPPFYGFSGIAHTYFVFDFKGQAPVAISVEARRAKGQTYDAVSGLFNSYELIYVWGTEQDLTGRRAVVEKNPLYMYPVSGSIDSGRNLFHDLAAESQGLETQPRFYNSLTSNCTNELAKEANRAQPGAIPLNIGLFLPGYADRFLYERGFIPHDAPFETVRQRYSVADFVAANVDQPDFSEQLRQHLNVAAA